MNSQNLPMEQTETKAPKIYPIKLIREELGMTQSQFSTALEVDLIEISKAEEGLSEPMLTVSQFKKLRKLTGKEIHELPSALGKDYQIDNL